MGLCIRLFANLNKKMNNNTADVHCYIRGMLLRGIMEGFEQNSPIKFRNI